MAWVFLCFAVAAEICGTLGLRASAATPRVGSIALIALAYVVSFACLSVALRQLNVGVVYAIWSAVGTAAVASAGAYLFGDKLGVQAIIGISLIVVGVVVLVGAGANRHA